MNMKISDEVWVATALLHREQPGRASFEPGEIRERAQSLHPDAPQRPGVNPHLYLHCVANLPPNSATYRMLLRLPDKSLRLYRSGDPCDPGRRKGRMTPAAGDLPNELVDLLDWYRNEYDSQSRSVDDPILGMVGLGQDIWRELGGGDAVLAWLRSDDPNAMPPWEAEADQGEDSWAPTASATFWENLHELRRRGMLPRRWRAQDLRPHLEGIYKLSTIRTMPANWSVSRDGGEMGESVKSGRRPKAIRLGDGSYELIDDPDRKAA